MNEIVFQVVSWETNDEDQYEITLYGRTKDGKSVSLTTPFEPYFFIQIPPWTTAEALWVELKPFVSNKTLDIIQGVSTHGFTNSTKKNFMKLNFKTHADMRSFVWKCKSKRLKIFESSIDPLLRFMHRTNIQSTGWVSCTHYEQDYNTKCEIQVFCPEWRNLKPVDDDSIAPLKISSIDIECYSSTGNFPDPNVKDDTLFQIALTTKTYGSDKIQKVCFSLGNVDRSDAIIQCSTEKDLLDKFTEYINDIDPDIITGWNIFGFDMEYIIKRMILCGCEPYTRCMGKRREKESNLVVKQLASGALGENYLKMVPMAGRYIFDLFQIIKAEHKLESYSLNNVSLQFLGDTKIDMPIREMFKLFKEQKNLTDVALYCIKDTELPLKIMEKLYTIENLIEMAKATWVPLNFLSERGQQIKVFSQIAKKARELKFMIPTLFEKTEQPEFQGATVLDAHIGAYFKPITALDFAGLYPSIMIAHNLCYSTLVLDEKYRDIPGIEYETHGNHTFAQNVPSLLPEILKDLKQFRKKAKKDMEKTKGTPMYHVYNGKQLAYKISMNSVYGFTGASRGMLPCVAIASTVTNIGRGMIQKSKEYVEEHFPGSIVRYGDSVMPDTLISVKGHKKMRISELSSLCSKYMKYSNWTTETQKEYCFPIVPVQVMTHIGWKDVRRVIRHYTKSKIYKVTTDKGSWVQVTGDHSLLTSNLQEIKPSDLKIGTEMCSVFGSEKVSRVDLIFESYVGYVYDLETEAGSFHAGVGHLIVKNTDSIMVQFDVGPRTGKEAIEYSWKLGEQASKEITEIFKRPNELELEKVYCPYFLYSKKRYAAKKWVHNGSECVFDEIDVKGLQVIRRDTCPYVRDTCEQLINMFMESDDVKRPLEYIQERKRMLIYGEVPMEKLILSKRLGDSYKNQNLAHVVVRNKMRERAPGSEPQSGDRVRFVLVKGPKKAKMYEKAEDPSWVVEHGLELDYEYYLKHQFETPVSDLIEPLLK